MSQTKATISFPFRPDTALQLPALEGRRSALPAGPPFPIGQRISFRNQQTAAHVLLPPGQHKFEKKIDYERQMML